MNKKSLNFDLDSVRYVSVSRNDKYTYLSFSMSEDDVYSSFSVEWKDGAVVPDVVMDIMALLQPKTKEMSSIKADDDTKAFFARLSSFYGTERCPVKLEQEDAQ